VVTVLYLLSELVTTPSAKPHYTTANQPSTFRHCRTWFHLIAEHAQGQNDANIFQVNDHHVPFLLASARVQSEWVLPWSLSTQCFPSKTYSENKKNQGLLPGRNLALYGNKHNLDNSIDGDYS
jgi:hypothetical protein